MLEKINFVIIITITLFNKCFQEKIIFAFQINRHGARSPYSGLKNGIDVYKEKWYIERNELSNLGKRQLYLLGVKARKRYIETYNLLNKEYNPQEIYIRSTDHNRTIESIYSYLQGLYPSGTGYRIKEKVYNNRSLIFPPNKKYYEEFEKIIKDYNMSINREALPFQMTLEPIHIFYKPSHEFELYDPDICTTLYDSFVKQNEREEIKDYANDIINATNGLLIDLEPNAQNETYFYDYWNLYKYTDNFICDDTDNRGFEEMKNNFTYVNDTILENLKIKSKKFLEEDSILTNNWVNLSIVGTSYTMHSLLNWMEKAINNSKSGIDNNYIKFVIYSAHDSSVGNIEGFMKYAFNTSIEFADFADSRFFELYTTDDKNYKVRYLKGDDTAKLDIDFDEFKNVVNNKTWSDKEVNEFCHFKENKNRDKENEHGSDKIKDDDDKKNVRLIILIILSVVNGVLLVTLIALLIFMKKKTS